jgi:hypothetical protein
MGGTYSTHMEVRNVDRSSGKLNENVNLKEWYENDLSGENLCFDFLYNFCLKHFSRRIQRDIIKKNIGLHVKYPLFLLDSNQT